MSFLTGNQCQKKNGSSCIVWDTHFWLEKRSKLRTRSQKRENLSCAKDAFLSSKNSDSATWPWRRMAAQTTLHYSEVFWCQFRLLFLLHFSDFDKYGSPVTAEKYLALLGNEREYSGRDCVPAHSSFCIDFLTVTVSQWHLFLRWIKL